jgi:hypothetical protein
LILLIKKGENKWKGKIRNWFVKKYHAQGFIYLDDGGSPTIFSGRVKWLENITVETNKSEKGADKLMFDYLNEKHPNYKGFIYLF